MAIIKKTTKNTKAKSTMISSTLDLSTELTSLVVNITAHPVLYIRSSMQVQ